MIVGDPCWRDITGKAILSLPWRVILPDGSTRTDPSQWSEDVDVLTATGWYRSTITEADVSAEISTPQPPLLGWTTPQGWQLSMTPNDVALLTGLYVLATRRSQLGDSRAITVTDIAGEKHTMTFEEFDTIMLAYGAAMEEMYGKT